MDSDQFDEDDIVEDMESEQHKQLTTGPASIALAPQQSYSSSFTSATGLLRSGSKKSTDKYSGPASAVTDPSSQPSIPEIKRKQFRPKDQYALAIDSLDDDDNDDIEGLSLVLPKRRDEESLSDFLRNTPPPPPPPPTQPFLLQNGNNNKTVQKKSSSVSLMSRFSRSSRKNSISSIMDKPPPMPALPTYATSGSSTKYMSLPSGPVNPTTTIISSGGTGRARSGSDNLSHLSREDFTQYGRVS